MWIKPKCGECGIGEYAQLMPTTLLDCTNEECDHGISVADFVDIDDWRLVGGLVEILDLSL